LLFSFVLTFSCRFYVSQARVGSEKAAQKVFSVP
jgi:hypothetical protein